MTTSIEHRIEADGEQPDYSGREFTADEIADGAHRRFVGGVWDSHGQRQLEWLKTRGLQPHHRMVDIGCGCFRAGRERRALLWSRGFPAASPAASSQPVAEPSFWGPDGDPGLPGACLRGTRAGAASRSASQAPSRSAPRERDADSIRAA